MPKNSIMVIDLITALGVLALTALAFSAYLRDHPRP